jgi:uncharacterized protein (DUF1778 family)
MSKEQTNKCMYKDYRIAVAPLSSDERALILAAKRRMRVTRPVFYKTAILEKATKVLEEKDEITDY